MRPVEPGRAKLLDLELDQVRVGGGDPADDVLPAAAVVVVRHAPAEQCVCGE